MNETSLFTGDSDDGTFVPFTDILFNALLTPVTYAAVVAPPAAAYRQLTREAADA